MPRDRLGNCLCGAACLMWRFRTLGVRYLVPKGGRVPHFYVVDRRGRKWHFRRERDVLPWPFRLLWFRGRVRKMRRRHRHRREGRQ